MKIEVLPRAVSKEIRKIRSLIPSHSLINAILNYACFIVAISYWKVKTEAFGSSYLVGGLTFYSTTSNDTSVSTTSFGVVLWIWIGSLATGTVFLFFWLFWGISIFHILHLKKMFNKQFEFASRWIPHLVSLVFVQIVNLAILKTFVLSDLISIIAMQIGVDSLLMLGDQVNRVYILEHLSESPIHLEGFTKELEIKVKSDIETDKQENGEDETEEVDEVKRTRLCLLPYMSAILIEAYLCFLYLYSLFTESYWTGVGNFVVIQYCVSCFLFILGPLVPLISYWKISPTSQHWSTMIIFCLSTVMQISTLIIVFVGLY